jgi:hypothetical protein
MAIKVYPIGHKIYVVEDTNLYKYQQEPYRRIGKFKKRNFVNHVTYVLTKVNILL